MYCLNCGQTIKPNQAFCTKCGTPVSQAAPAPPPVVGGVNSAEVADKVKAASADAVAALKIFAADPIGGLLPAFESLDKQRAMMVGIVFGAVFVLCVTLGGVIGVARFGGLGIVDILRTFIMGAVVFMSIVGSSALARMAFKGAGSLEGDFFIAGTSLLPMGLFALLSGVIGIGGFEIITILFVFAMCYTVLMLYTGCTKISKLPDSRAALAVSAMLTISMLAARIIIPRMI